MATEAEINKVIYDWMDSVLSIDVFEKDQPRRGQSDGAPQPTGSYATFKFISGPRREGLVDEERPPDADNPSEELIIAGQRLSTLSIETFGTGAKDNMIALQNSLQKTEDIKAALKRKQTTVVTVDSPTIAGFDYVVTAEDVPSTTEAVSSLSLDGNGFADRTLGASITFPLVFEIRFNPSFALNDGSFVTFFDATGDSLHRALFFKENTTDDLVGRVRNGGGNIFPVRVTFANVSPYWNALDWNTLRYVLVPTGGSQIYLNETALQNDNSGVSFTPSTSIDDFLAIGALVTSSGKFSGLIDYVRVAASDSDMDAGIYIYEWEFNGDYTEAIASLDLTAQGTGNSFDLDSVEEVRDNLIIAINASDYTEVTAEAGIPDGEIILSSGIGKEFTVSLSANLTLGATVSAVDLAVVGDEGIIDVAELLDTAWEPRQGMDIILRSHTIIVTTPDYIENAEINGDISGNETTITVET